MIELINLFDLTTYDTQNISSFHLAEGPGGFIEAFSFLRNAKNDRYIGMTLQDNKNNMNVPSWKKSNVFLNNNPNVFIENGEDNTGNILSINNFYNVCQKYGQSMDFITADGGFDFSNDFDNQEINMSELLYGQVVYALCLQRKYGNFVLKIFDSFFQHTVDILYLLSSFYEYVYITKPKTSRSANSEKYIVCKGFLFDDAKDYFPYLCNSFKDMMNHESLRFKLLNIKMPIYFISKLEEYNSIFGQQQIENIHSTISLIVIEKNNENQEKIVHNEQKLYFKFENNIKNNVLKCVQWCIANNMQYNVIYDISRKPNNKSFSEYSK
jgi:23S rRNA U2552 (ribose-2'-O)-methylase RlmE/FtsJ